MEMRFSLINQEDDNSYCGIVGGFSSPFAFGGCFSLSRVARKSVSAISASFAAALSEKYPTRKAKPTSIEGELKASRLKILNTPEDTSATIAKASPAEITGVQNRHRRRSICQS